MAKIIFVLKKTRWKEQLDARDQIVGPSLERSRNETYCAKQKNECV